MEKFFKYLSAVISCLLIISMLSLTVVIPVYKNSARKIDLFDSQKITDNVKNLELNMTTIIYAKNADGDWEEYYRLHGDENRIWVDIDKMPKILQEAFIAIEDERFEKHKGVDWKRTFSAVANEFFEFSEVEFGGSSITQQLVKNITSDRSKNYMRKIREIIRALSIEKKISKKSILEAYLNTIALGNGICGVEVAANYYFNKKVSDLTLLECAAIAGITKNPSKYNPIRNPEDNKERRNTVLVKMLELGYISQEEFNENYNKELVLDNTQRKDYESEVNSYFVDTLIEQVIEDLSEKYKCDQDIASQMLYNGGYKIYSTVDTSIQSLLESTYENKSKYFSEYKTVDGKKEYVQSAMTVMDYEGHIVGIVGGTGEKTVNRSLNRAYSVPRQPGSTMKPIGVYAQAIERDLLNYTSIVHDKPLKNYRDGKEGPREWFGAYLGDVPLNYALRKSMNAVPVQILNSLVGVEESYEFLTEKLHFKYLIKDDMNLSSLALGGCHYGITPTESAAAFSIFGNGGVYHKPTTYYTVKQTDGEVILKSSKKGEQVISGATATIMNHLLQEVVYQSEGTARTIAGFNYKMKAYAKTGTSSETKDSWLVAGTPYYIASVWYGYDHNYKIVNSNNAKAIWRDIMSTIHKDLKTKNFEDSEDVFKKGVGYYKDGTKPENVYASIPEATTSSDETATSTPTTENAASTTSSVVSSSSSQTSSEQTSSDQQTSDTENSSNVNSDSQSSLEPPSSSEPPTPSGQ